MFKLKENNEVNRRFLKCEYICYSPAETSTKKTPNCQIYINIHREDSAISLLNSYLDLKFDVIKKVDDSRYGDGNEIRLVNLRPIALFSNFRLTKSSGKSLQDISHAHIVFLMYQLLTSCRGGGDLSLGFHRDRGVRRDELTRNRNINGEYHLRIMLNDVFGFVEYLEQATYGLG